MNKTFVIVLYIRISVEDEDSREGIRDESNSVSNQRDLLRRFIGQSREFEGRKVM